VKPRNVILAVISIASFGTLALLVTADILISRCESKTYDDINLIPSNDVAVVLGTTKTLSNGRTNLYFSYRIDAVAKLYNSKKIKFIIASGDNSRHDYNEPEDIKNALILRGIPAESIYCDYAGFRTLDSIRRANAIFSITSFTVVSQKFHNARAIYLAENYGLNAIGFNAKNTTAYEGATTNFRELFAKAKCILDIHIFSTEPKFYGDKIKIL